MSGAPQAWPGQHRPDTPAERTAAIIVTYGARASTVIAAVEAARIAGAGLAVIVLNGVDPTTGEAVRSAVEPTAITSRFVALQRNGGSAGGYAAGIAAALEIDRADYLWLLDDDNRPVPTALSAAHRLMQDLESSRGPGSVAVSCARPADRAHGALLNGAQVAAVFPDEGAFLNFDIRQRLRRRLRPVLAGPETGIVLLPAAPYGGLLISARLARQVGLPRADFVLYEDDVEYSYRITGSGSVLALADDAIVLEADKLDPPKSMDGSRPLVKMLRTPPDEQHRLFYQYRNRVYLDRQRVTSARTRAAFWINASIYLTVTAVLGTRSKNRIAFRAFHRAVRDGLRGRLGQTYGL